MMGSVNDFVAFSISKYSPEMKRKWLQVSPIQQPMDKSSEIMHINNFLRIQLGLLDVDTTQARECLVVEPDFDSWARNFEQYVVPVIVKHGLPAWQKL